jgi:hypothetical protein
VGWAATRRAPVEEIHKKKILFVAEFTVLKGAGATTIRILFTTESPRATVLQCQGTLKFPLGQQTLLNYQYIR